MTESTCPLCHTDSHKLFQYMNEPESISLNECHGCKSQFLDPQPSDSLLQEEYSHYYQRRSGELLRQRVPLFQSILAKHLPHLTPSHIVDIGSGEGDCAVALHDRWPDAHISCIEMNNECRPYYDSLPVTLFDEPIETWCTNNPTPSDLIVAFDLFEHLRAPETVLNTLSTTVLNQDGYLLASFPNCESLSRSLMNRYWFQFKTEHLFYFSEKGVRKLCSDAGLNIVHLAPLKKKLPLGYLLRVGSTFGPPLIQKIIGGIAYCTPQPFQNLLLTLPLGEWLLVAQKKSI